MKYYKYTAIEKNNSHGTYNLSCYGETTWFNFAKYVLGGINENSNYQSEIKSVNSDYFKSDVKRPKYSVLSSKKITEQFDIKIPSWQYYADKYIESFNE